MLSQQNFQALGKEHPRPRESWAIKALEQDTYICNSKGRLGWDSNLCKVD